MVSILFVCYGNICRSPTAEGVFRKLVEDAGLSDRCFIDSAGTHGFHSGSPPDPRSQEAALHRGVDMSSQASRQVGRRDFERFDLILAMDRQNLTRLQSFCPPAHAHKIALFLDYAPESGVEEVPDPYYGGPSGFEDVLDLIGAASKGLLEAISAS